MIGWQTQAIQVILNKRVKAPTHVNGFGRWFVKNLIRKQGPGCSNLLPEQVVFHLEGFLFFKETMEAYGNFVFMGSRRSFHYIRDHIHVSIE
mmetsp:Transcript_13336/g.17262  ORF Transcript_13336/g.17262 Transcript_13336/m.17262 type:complete len:92 (+) Transcript_13336:666-941(+)